MKYFIGNNLFEYEEFINTTIEHCVEYCEQQKVLGLDIETTRKFEKNKFKQSNYKQGLDPYMSNICMLQIGDLKNQFIIDVRYINIKPLKSVLENKSILKVGHNLRFECKHIGLNYKMFLDGIWDTFICEKILYNGLPIGFSLEALSYRYLNSTKVEKQTSMFNDVEEKEYEFSVDEFDWVDNAGREYKIDKSTRMEFLDIENDSFTLKQLEYGVDDITMPLEIYYKQREGRFIAGTDDLYKPDLAFKIENKFVSTLAKIELRGISVDTVGWMEMYYKNCKKRYEIQSLLDSYVIKYYPKFASQLNLFSSSSTCSIEWESSKQVISLFKHLKICPKEYSPQTKRVEYTVGAKSLSRLLNNEYKDRFMKLELPEMKEKNNQDLILCYLIYKKFQILTTTFGEEWIQKYIHPITKKVHSSYNQLMHTGRLSSQNPNQQNLPNGQDWRKLFITDKYLTASDYSSQESRVAAMVHNEPKMQDFFINGHPIHGSDMHCFVATEMYKILRDDPNLIITKKENKERSAAKALGFKIIFGGSGYTIAKDFDIPEEEGEKFVNAYLDSFPGLKQSFEDKKRLATERGWVYTCEYTGKRYFYADFPKIKEYQDEFFSYFGKDYQALSTEERQKYKENLYKEKPFVKALNSKAGRLKGKIERISLNYRCQGTAATMTKIACILIDEYYPNLDEGICLTAHDEIVLDLFKKEQDSKIEGLMKKAGDIVFSGKMPMDAVSTTGKYWIH